MRRSISLISSRYTLQVFLAAYLLYLKTELLARKLTGYDAILAGLWTLDGAGDLFGAMHSRISPA